MGSGSVRSSNHTVSGTLKNEFYLPFSTQVFHPWWSETCRVIQQQFRMKECDILGGGAGKTYSDHSYIFSGGQESKPLSPRDVRLRNGQYTSTVWFQLGRNVERSSGLLFHAHHSILYFRSVDWCLEVAQSSAYVSSSLQRPSRTNTHTIIHSKTDGKLERRSLSSF